MKLVNYMGTSYDVEKIKSELLEAEKRELKKRYPNDDAWRAPRNIADTWGCVGCAQYELDNFKQKLDCMSDTEIIKKYKWKK